RGGEWRRVPQFAIAASLVYIAFNLGLSQTAHDRVRLRAPQVEAIFASPEPVLFWRRKMVWRQEGVYRWASFSPLSGLGPAHGPIEPQLGNPLVLHAVRSDPALRNFLRWSVLPFAWAEPQRCAVVVALGDARYLSPGGYSRLSRETVLPRPCQAGGPAG
ncbi:MAG TPA: hypothetical protein VHN20_13075, partial [Beijerinckiaceae bacterium]|nr:hypothetical protein [Beijerinckiaceae bacterium]